MIRVCTPYYCDVHPRAVASVERLVEFGRTHGIQFQWVKARGTSIHTARDALVNDYASFLRRQSLPSDISHYLMLDSDIEFEPEDVLLLLEARRHIVSGAYVSRAHPGRYCAGMFDKPADGMVSETRMVERGDKWDGAVDWCGMGFCLIAREVFEKIEYPWFTPVIIEWTQGGKRHAEGTGEDIAFCLRAAAAGYKVYLDADCVVTHLIEEDGGMMAKKAQKTPQVVGKQAPVAAQQVGGQQRITVTPDRALVEIMGMFDAANLQLSSARAEAYGIIRQLSNTVGQMEQKIGQLEAELADLKPKTEKKA